MTIPLGYPVRHSPMSLRRNPYAPALAFPTGSYALDCDAYRGSEADVPPPAILVISRYSPISSQISLYGN